ncbi:MAG: hypothetical protein BWY87_01719 [Deltaproteobacteria bacterium ADurb.Bin510]|nr:MAG: hypothetical protein BWY87_01719 [Deltaproteobacteria bacterium ADurb.Bin510]
MVRVQVMAVNMLTATPSASTKAKPFTGPEPKLPRKKQVIRVQALESRIDGNARLKPASMPARSVLPSFSSSLRRSKIRMFASTAMPIERMKPAMPGRVSVTGMILKSAKVKIV